MDRSDLEALFTEVLDLPGDVDWSTVRYQEVERWDSLAHMALVAELEDRLGIMLDTDDVIDMSTFDKAVEILGKYDITVE